MRSATKQTWTATQEPAGWSFFFFKTRLLLEEKGKKRKIVSSGDDFKRGAEQQTTPVLSFFFSYFIFLWCQRNNTITATGLFSPFSFLFLTSSEENYKLTSCGKRGSQRKPDF